MHHPTRVRGIERVHNLDGQVEQLIQLHRPRLNEFPKLLSLQVLHHQKRLAGGFVEIVQRADIRVIECGDRPRLTLETLDRYGVAGQRLGHELQRDGAAQAYVFGLVHNAHAALAECCHYPVMRNCFPDH